MCKASFGLVWGGLQNAGTALLIGTVVRDSSVSTLGGFAPRGAGIASTGTLELRSTAVTENTVDGWATEDAGHAGGIDASGQTMIIASVISNNRARTTTGGLGNAGTMTITGSTITGNVARGIGACSTGGGIANQGTLTIADSAIASNIAQGSGACSTGGGIANAASLTLSTALVASNSAFIGGGLRHTGPSLTVTNVTVSGNSGGGILSEGVGATLTNATIAANGTFGVLAVSSVRRVAGTLSLKNTILATRSDAPSDQNCSATLTSIGHNLATNTSCGLAGSGDLQSTNPSLGPLADNGGLTQTHALLVGSPALDAGDNTGCPLTDQRGSPRPRDGGRGVICDIGAYEAQVALSILTPTSTLTPSPTLTPTATATATPVAACAPRPRVELRTEAVANGRLQVTLVATTSSRTPSNWLQRLRFERLENAAVDSRDFTNQRAPFVQELPEQPRQAIFTVNRLAPGPFMVTLAAVDHCGSWPTFVGDGPSAF